MLAKCLFLYLVHVCLLSRLLILLNIHNNVILQLLQITVLQNIMVQTIWKFEEI